MPSRDWKLRIRDILESVAAVESYVADMTFEAFAGDAQFRRSRVFRRQ